MMFQRISKSRACPVCKNAEVYRVKRMGLPVKVVCRIFDLRPHWCPECDTFFLGPRQQKSTGSGELGFSNREGKSTGQPDANRPATLKEKTKSAVG